MAVTAVPTGLLTPGAVLAADPRDVGGKAQGLARLDQLLAGTAADVPPFRVLPSAAFRSHLAHPRVREVLGETLLRFAEPGPDAPLPPELISACSAQLVDALTSVELAPEVAGGVRAALDELGPGPWSVRSSMVGEDTAAHSFAGQLDSFLFLPDADAVCDAVRRCWASAFGERALAYGRRAGISPAAVRMGVVVQCMVDADLAGVLFTANPLNGARDEVLLTAAWGQGEGVVSGLCDADTYVFAGERGECGATVVEKDLQVRRDPSGTGTAVVPVDAARRTARVLSPAQVDRLGRLGLDLAGALGTPQDVEFAVAREQLYVLQTRPITALPEPGGDAGPVTLWDNSNIQESYCGVTTPLTFSFASRAYAIVYERFFRVAGTPERVVQANRDLLPQLLGLLDGRVYYNLNSWYAGCLLLPSPERSKEDMESMMGVDEPVDFVVDEHATVGSRLSAGAAMAPVVARLLPQLLTIDHRIARFREHFDATLDAIDRTELASMSFSRLMALVRHLDRELLERWDVPILNDVRVMRATGALRRSVAAALDRDAGDPEVRRLCSELLCDIEGIESIEPTRRLLRLAAVARSAPGVEDVLRSGPAAAALRALRADHPTFAARVDEYVHRYGDRVMGELKLETVSLREDPSFVIDILRGYLDRPDLDADTLGTHDRSYYRRAFDDVASRLPARRRTAFASKAKAAREAVKAREDLRFARTRMFGMYRSIYLAVGRILHETGHLDQPRDVFWLTTDELVAYNEGRSVTKDLAALARLRAGEFRQFEDVEVPHRVETRGPVSFGRRIPEAGGTPGTAAGTGTVPGAGAGDGDDALLLTGTGCHPGVVESAVRVVRSPGDRLALDGQILVAVRTDPGWTPIFPTCGGILVERGSVLSHSAVVARELGIPAIVGIPHLTDVLTDGERVRMDGGAGTVQRLDAAHGGEPGNDPGGDDPGGRAPGGGTPGDDPGGRAPGGGTPGDDPGGRAPGGGSGAAP